MVCAMGVVQAVHVHSENSPAVHHACSICLTAHAGLNVATVSSAPIMLAAALANPAQQFSGIFRPVEARFIRPPPAA
jgi:hypothetical protein